MYYNLMQYCHLTLAAKIPHSFFSVNQFVTDRSKAVLLLWFIFYIYVSCFSGIFVGSLQPCGHLLVKG